jgi:hypothetical protein
MNPANFYFLVFCESKMQEKYYLNSGSKSTGSVLWPRQNVGNILQVVVWIAPDLSLSFIVGP